MAIRAKVFACALFAALPAEAAACRASWYGGGEKLSSHTASGQRFNPKALTAAHRTWVFGTRVRVTYRGRSVVVTINDRGPAKSTGKCIDLSRAAAEAIGMRKAGVGTVTLQRLN